MQRLQVTDRDCLSDLSKRQAHSENPALKMLATWEMARRQELATEGERKQIELLLYATYTQTQGLVRGEDWIAAVLNSVQLGLKLFWLPLKLLASRGMHLISGELQQQESKVLRQFLRKAYIEGYFRWNAYLTQKLVLSDAQGLTSQECWEELWQSLNRDDAASSIPSVIEVTTNRIVQRQNIDIDPRRLLLRHIPEGHPSFIQVADRYQMVARCIAKPGGAESGRAVMRHLWDYIYNSCDLEILTQVSRADVQTTRAILGFQSRRATHVSKRAEAMDMPDVGATLTKQASLDAEAALIGGVGVIHVGFLIKITAPTRATAEGRLRDLCRRFPVPMIVEIDRHNAWNSWLQSLIGLNWCQLGRYGVFDQRLLMLSSEVPLLLPLTLPRGGKS